jgi:hypothetical protein
MSVTAFIPEIWAAQLQTSLKKALVFGGVCNRDYEGLIANQGDTVRITTVGRPTIAAYTKDSTVIAPETLTDASRTLVIDQAYYFAFEIDDIDKRQAVNGGALMAEAAQEAAYALADTIDQYIVTIFAAGTAAANIVAATSRATSDLCLTGVVDLKTLLDVQNVPTQGRYLIIPPWVHAKLLLQDEFLVADALQGGQGLGNGMVGRIMGFNVMLSNNGTISDTVDDTMVYAGHPGAITLATQIDKVEGYRPQTSFSDALKGLMLWGVKVVRPTAIATSVFSKT